MLVSIVVKFLELWSLVEFDLQEWYCFCYRSLGCWLFIEVYAVVLSKCYRSFRDLCHYPLKFCTNVLLSKFRYREVR